MRNKVDQFQCDVCGEPIPIGQEIQVTVDGEPCLRHPECQFEQCSRCEELIAPGEECYHDYGAGEVGVFCPKCDDFEVILRIGVNSMNKEKEQTFLQAIQCMQSEVNKRFEERGESERVMYATPEEVRALRSLAGTLVMLFGPFPTVEFK